MNLSNALWSDRTWGEVGAASAILATGLVFGVPAATCALGSSSETTKFCMMGNAYMSFMRSGSVGGVFAKSIVAAFAPLGLTKMVERGVSLATHKSEYVPIGGIETDDLSLATQRTCSQRAKDALWHDRTWGELFSVALPVATALVFGVPKAVCKFDSSAADTWCQFASYYMTAMTADSALATGLKSFVLAAGLWGMGEAIDCVTPSCASKPSLTVNS